MTFKQISIPLGWANPNPLNQKNYEKQNKYPSTLANFPPNTLKKFNSPSVLCVGVKHKGEGITKIKAHHAKAIVKCC
jgi:hypothetical protein